MNLTTERSATASEDHVAQVLEQYLADQRAGRAPSRQQLRDQYPDLAHDLDECLETLEYLEGWELGPVNPPGAAPLTRDQLLSRTLGDFRIIRELGRGGMGIVYEAEQLSLSRRVALKILPFAAVLDPRHLQRFKNEAIAAAQLAHPHIVDVHGVGCERGVHFYAMRLIEGQTLAAVIDALRLAAAGTAPESSRLAPRDEPVPRSHAPLGNEDNVAGTLRVPSPHTECADNNDTLAAALSTLRTTRPKDFYRRVAELGIQAAEALDHAHQMGIIHRDIKPSNLMLECSPLDRSHPAPRDAAYPSPSGRGQGEGASQTTDHRPLTTPKLWITDFGLARIQTNAGMTLTGDLLGTLRYMSPEQAEGKSAFLDHRTDIYSLGVTLYELLTLHPAFPADDRQTLLRQIANDEPTPARKLNLSVPAELETILLKAIAKDPAERYATAREFADDLGRFRDQKAIKARPPTVWQRVNKLVWRHPAVSVSTICVLLVALIATLAAYRISSREQSKTADALLEKSAALEQADENLDFAQDAVDGMYTRLATQWMADNAAPTQLQRDFLNQAAAFYERIAHEIPPGDDQLHRVAVAYQRLGAIQYYLEQYAAAAESLEHALRLGEQLAASEPRSLVIKDLPSTYRLRAVIQLKLGDRDAARQAVDAGKSRLDKLIQQEPASLALQFEQVEFDHIQAHLLVLQRQFAEAATCLRRARQTLREQRQPSRPSLHLRIDTSLVENHQDLAKIHLAEGRLSAAREEFQQGLKVIERAHQFGYTDFRPLAELQKSLTKGLGKLAEHEGDYEHAATPSTNASSFIGLGDLPGGQVDSGLGPRGIETVVISRDGSVVVGTRTFDHNREAFRWTLESGVVGLGRLAPQGAPLHDNPIGPFSSTASAVNANGDVVVGYSVSERTDHQEAYRWTDDTRMTGLGFLDGFKPRISRSRPLHVSDDGSIIVGVNNTYPNDFRPSRTGAFRWTKTDGMVDLGGPPEFSSWPHHQANLVSGDGAVIVGSSSSGGNFSQKQGALWRWTEQAGFSVFDQSPSALRSSSATDITPDGSVIVGYGGPAKDSGFERFRHRPYRWTEESGLVELDGWDLDTFGTVTYVAVTDDGATIVGSPGTFNYYPANAVPPSFIWDQQHGMRDLSQVLSSEYGLANQMEGWKSLRATDISGDGRRIVGTGVNPQGFNEAWIAILRAVLPAGDSNANGLVEQADLNLLFQKP